MSSNAPNLTEVQETEIKVYGVRTNNDSKRSLVWN